MSDNSGNIPAKTLVRSGVITMAPIVEAEVISTERATSPWAMNVATFEACPPGQQETRIRPTAKASGRERALAIRNPSTGLIKYWAT